MPAGSRQVAGLSGYMAFKPESLQPVPRFSGRAVTVDRPNPIVQVCPAPARRRTQLGRASPARCFKFRPGAQPRRVQVAATVGCLGPGVSPRAVPGPTRTPSRVKCLGKSRRIGPRGLVTRLMTRIMMAARQGRASPDVGRRSLDGHRTPGGGPGSESRTPHAGGHPSFDSEVLQPAAVPRPPVFSVRVCAFECARACACRDSDAHPCAALRRFAACVSRRQSRSLARAPSQRGWLGGCAISCIAHSSFGFSVMRILRR